jgi:hypothetical protein
MRLDRSGSLLVAVLALPLLVFAFGPAEKPPGEPTDFLRFRQLKDGGGLLETAIVTYVGEGGVEVDLVGAVHVADAAYYEALGRAFSSYDAVLYEMIKPKGVEPVKREGGPDNLLSAFQRGLKTLLGLEFQLDAIDYRKKNFVHADLDPETFFRLQREKGETFLSLLWKIFRRELELEASGKGRRPIGVLELVAAFSSRDSARALKLLLARQMEDVELLMAGIDDGESTSVIVGERNKAALGVLSEVLEAGSKKRIAIFYGAAHMPDLERRLEGEFGLEKSRTRWVTAWDVTESRPGEGPGDSPKNVEDHDTESPDTEEGSGSGEERPGEELPSEGEKPRERVRSF